jgi:hypothetical protein
MLEETEYIINIINRKNEVCIFNLLTVYITNKKTIKKKATSSKYLKIGKKVILVKVVKKTLKKHNVKTKSLR